MNKIRLGHYGTLHDHSSAKLACARKFPEVFEIVGVVAESEERQKQIETTKEYNGLTFFSSKEELVAAGIDAVLIEGFELNLVKDAQYFAEKGIHVHIDKPAGFAVEDLERLYDTAEKTGAVVQFAYMYRYNYALRDCMERVRRGELGEIYEVDAVMDTGHPAEKRAWLENLPGGIMFFLGCHMIDLVYLLMGKPKNIIPFLKSTGFDGVNVIDHGMAVFEYEKGVSYARATSTEINGYGRRQLVVCGEKGTYEIMPLECPTRAYFTSKDEAKTFHDCKTELSFPQIDNSTRYDELIMDFVRYIRGDAKNPYDRTYEVTLQKMLLFCCGQDVDWRN